MPGRSDIKASRKVPSAIAQLSRPSTERGFSASNTSVVQLGMKTVNITRLKGFAAEKLPHHSALSKVLLQEKDEVPASEFLARVPVYLVLLRCKEE